MAKFLKTSKMSYLDIIFTFFLLFNDAVSVKYM
jgi:hypothetical protein